METETASSSAKPDFKTSPLLLLGFALGIAVGVFGTFIYFSYFGKLQGFDYSKINWFQKSSITPTITEYQNPFSQSRNTTPSITPSTSAIPSASPTYVNPFDLIGQ